MASERAIVICPVVPYPETGGSHKRTMRLIEAVEAAGVTPHLVTADPSRPESVAALRARGWGVDVVPGPPRSARHRAHQHLRRLPSPYLAGVAQRVRELVAEGCVFVQVEHTQSAYYERAIGSARWVLSLHNVDSMLMRSVVRSQRPSRQWVGSLNRWRALQTVERRSVPKAHAVLCVSDEDRRELERLRPRRVLVVPNGVDDAFFDVPAALPPDEEVLFFGQLDYPPNALGMERFLREGWALVAAERPGARLRLVGARMGEPLRRAVEAAERVEAVGWAEDLVAEVAAASVVVVPIWAGGGTRLKALESLASARPVAGTPLGMEGIGFQGGRHGELAEDPAELGRRVAGLLADRARAERLAAGGRELAERFRWRRATEPARRLYEELAAPQVRTVVHD